MKNLIFIIIAVLIGTTAFADDAVINPMAESSSSPAPMKIEDWHRLLNSFRDELKALQAISALPNSPDFKKTRRAMLSKYIQLYVKVCDAKNKHDSF